MNSLYQVLGGSRVELVWQTGTSGTRGVDPGQLDSPKGAACFHCNISPSLVVPQVIPVFYIFIYVCLYTFCLHFCVTLFISGCAWDGANSELYVVDAGNHRVVVLAGHTGVIVRVRIFGLPPPPSFFICMFLL